MQSFFAQPVALQALIASAAALVGILAGILIRGAIARSDKNGLIHRNEELVNALTQAGNALSESMALAAKRAGFETLAEEREKRIAELTKDLERERTATLTVIEAMRTELQTRSDDAARLSATVAELNAKLEGEQKTLPEKIAVLEAAKLAFSEHFKSVGTEVLERLSKTHTEGSQKDLANLLNPLRDQINDFRKKVEEVQIDSKTGVTELKTLIGTMGTLNKALTEEAHNLATALRRDTKAQGNWGETILRNILDKSGLQEGTHYSFQQSHTEMTAEGDPGQRRQTDVVVKLPGGRNLIIDSKVSLNAYNDSINAADEKDRVDAIKRHLVSVRSHFNELAGRNYHSLPGIQSPDFVVMFVPIEPAFLLALQNDESLWHDAYSKGVLLSGPTTVLFVIRIVADLWRQEMQVQNVKEIVDRGAKLYEKFVGFIDDLEKIGKGLRDASGYYDEARRKLSGGPGNLVAQVETLRKLGVKPRKQIPPGLLDTSEAETTATEPSEAEPAASEAPGLEPSGAEPSGSERVSIFEVGEPSSVEAVVEQGIAESDAV